MGSVRDASLYPPSLWAPERGKYFPLLHLFPGSVKAKEPERDLWASTPQRHSYCAFRLYINPVSIKELSKTHPFQPKQKTETAPALRGHGSLCPKVLFVLLVTTSRDHDFLSLIK